MIPDLLTAVAMILTMSLHGLGFVLAALLLGAAPWFIWHPFIVMTTIIFVVLVIRNR